MAKQLRDILKAAHDTIKGVRPSTTSPLSLGTDPGVDYDPKAGDERDFVAAHSVQKWDDPAGNPNFSKDIKHVLDRAGEDRHGHKNDEAKKKSVLPVKEEVDLKKAKGMQCNESPEGVACPVHGLKECMNETARATLKEKGVNETFRSDIMKKASMKGYQDSRKGQPPLQDTKSSAKATLAQYKKKIHPQSDFEKKTFKEESDLEENKLYHVSWGPGAEHQVVAKHGDEAVSKAKSAILKKVPKLGDEKYAATWKKSPRVTNLTHERKVQKEEVALDEAVTVKKTTHPWGKMVTVHHGSSHSFPLHPEHQEKIAKLKNGEHTSFTDETNKKVKAHREGDTIHLSQNGVNKSTPVARHHFAEETQIDELSKATLGSYVKKASKDAARSGLDAGRNKDSAEYSKVAKKKMIDRLAGIAKATDKLTKEEVEQVDEEKMTTNLHALVGKFVNHRLEAYKNYYKNPTKHDEHVSHLKKIRKQIEKHHGAAGIKKAEDEGYKVIDHHQRDIGEETQIDEVITKKTSAGEVISDFIHSKNPKFAGKSKEERKRMALGAYYSKHPEKSKSVKEDLAVPLLGSKDDDESAEMAKAQLKALANKAMHLVMQLPDSMILEPWVQSKITLAKDYVNTVHDYMVYGDHDKDKENKKEDMPDTAGGSAGGSMVVNQMDTPMTFPNMSVDVNTGRNV